MTVRSMKSKKRKAKIALDKDELSFYNLKLIGVGFTAGILPMIIMKISGEIIFVPWPLILMAPVVFILGMFALATFLLLIDHVYTVFRCKYKKDCPEKDSNEDSTYGP